MNKLFSKFSKHFYVGIMLASLQIFFGSLTFICYGQVVTTMTTKQLTESTYLGHASELTLPNEDPLVLQKYLELNSHGVNKASDRELQNMIVYWATATELHPDSIHAWAGLGKVEQLAGEQAGDKSRLRDAAEAYLRAAKIAIANGRVLYTRQLSEILVQVGDTRLLDRVFSELTSASASPKEQYLTLVDYADALANLSDDRAALIFEKAIDSYKANNIEAINRYAGYLLKSNRAESALKLLDTKLTRDQRMRFVVPSERRLDALMALKGDTTDAEAEVLEIYNRMPSNSLGMVRSKRTDVAAAPAFIHNGADDCRNPREVSCIVQTLPDGSQVQNCFFPQAVNLAEILSNEARGERIGAIDMVGWTVRDRVFQNLINCDNSTLSYNGGFGSSHVGRCRTAIPCVQPIQQGFCPLEVDYCCAIHGGTTSAGTDQEQFNDGHVAFPDLLNTGFAFEAVNIENGFIPEPSTNFVPPGVTACNFGCDTNVCTLGTNITAASPSGPMEFLNRQYTATNASCKNSSGFVCPNGGNNNFFWNRKP